MQSRSYLPRGQCSVCLKPIDVHQQVRGGICDDARCRAAAATKAIARQDIEARAALEAVARKHLPVLLAESRLSPTDVDLLVLPGTDTAPHSPGLERRERFRSNIVAALKAVSADDAKPDSDTPAIAAQACAACRGMCCRHGGDRAYVDDGVVDKIRAQRPGLDDAGIVEFLMNAIPERTVADSCILHGERGCALPRELRSDVCNNFHCRPLWEWTRKVANEGAKPTAIVVADGNGAIRATLWRG